MSAEATVVTCPKPFKGTRVSPEPEAQTVTNPASPVLRLRVMAEPPGRTSNDEIALQGPARAGAMLGNYRLLFSVARGGMAEVWVARQHGARGFTKLVALKMILPDLATEEGFERMFAEEARLAGLIRHPNVCEVFELIELGGRLALSMEWVDGDTLARLLKGRGPLDPRVAARIVAESAAGLHAAHELRGEEGEPLNLVHRDVSPQNILISRDGHVKLSDFGIAKALSSGRETTAVGQVKGKISYMSPEQAEARPLDRRSDVFALGVVLYVATLGRRPFSAEGTNVGVMLERLRQGEFDRPRRVNPSFPPQLAAIIERALQSDPTRRYQTAAALRLDLENWLASSGPLLTEADVARVLAERRGGELDKRESSIRDALSPRPALGSDHGGGTSAWSSTVGRQLPTDNTIPDARSRFPSSSQALPSWLRPRGSALGATFVVGTLLALLVLGFGVLVSEAGGDPAHLPPEVVAAGPAPAPSPPALGPVADPMPPLETEQSSRRGDTLGASSSSRAFKPPPAPARARTATQPAVSQPRPTAKRIGPTERDL